MKPPGENLSTKRKTLRLARRGQLETVQLLGMTQPRICKCAKSGRGRQKNYDLAPHNRYRLDPERHGSHRERDKQSDDSDIDGCSSHLKTMFTKPPIAYSPHARLSCQCVSQRPRLHATVLPQASSRRQSAPPPCPALQTPGFAARVPKPR